MSDLAAMIKRRGIIKSTVTNIKKFVDKINSELESGQAINREQLETRAEKLNEAWKEFHDIENQILLIAGQISEAEEFEEKYFDTKSTLRRIFNVRNPSVIPDQANISCSKDITGFIDRSSYQTNEIRLPRISIESFNGDYAKWPSFSDQFVSAVHENESLSKIHKFQYLKGLLRGDAANLIRHLSMTDANYEHAWEKLQKRYNKKKAIAKELIELFLGQSKIKQCSHKQLRLLCDTSDEALRGLSAVGIEWEGRDPWLVHIIVKKLDSETQQLWAQHLNDIDSPTIDQLLEFLTNRCNALESCTSLNPNTLFRQNTNSKSHSATVDQNECLMCKSNHFLFQCFKFKRLKPSERIKFADDYKLCLNCLRSDHHTKTCESNKRCFICHKMHHTLIHVKGTVSNDVSKKSESITNALSTHTSHLSTTKNSSINNCDTTSINSTNNSSINSNNNSTINNANFNQPSSSIKTEISPTNKEFSTFNTDTKSDSTVSLLQNAKSHPHLRTRSLNQHKTLLSTVLVNIPDLIGKFHTVRALLDSGSQCTFITERCVQRIGIPRKHARFSINGLASKKAGFTRGAVDIKLHSKYDEGICIAVNAFILAKLTSQLPSHTIDISHWNKLKGLQLADPIFNTLGEIDLILGNDVFFEIILSKQIKVEEELFAHQTSFGWILGGKCNQPLQNSSISGFHTSMTSNNVELKALQLFWEIEELKSDSKSSTEEDYCETHYQRTTTRDKNGRYVVRLPFKEDIRTSTLGHSVIMATKRQLQMEKRFAKNEYLRENYVNFMNDYISLNHMTAIDERKAASSQSNLYLPHHAVLKESSSTTKLRVVFDGSCESTTGVSRNDILLVGPTIQKDLLAILLCFRIRAVAVCADIEKMYRQVTLHPDDRDFQRIIWRNNATKKYATLSA